MLIPADVEDSIRQKVETGRYSDATEVIREALRLLDSRDRLQQLRESLIQADREIERGEGEEWSPALMERLIREGDDMFRRGIKPDPDVCPQSAP
jgi:antitoxin ParD1/3/4